MLAVFVGVATVAAVAKIGAAETTPEVVAAAVNAALVAGVAVTAAVVPVTPPTKTPPPSPAPLVMTGVGAELIDEFTVSSGFAYNDGGINRPVGAV